MDNSFQKRMWKNIGLIAAAFVGFWLLFLFLAGRLEAVSAKIVADRSEAAQRTYAIENLSLLKTQQPVASAYKEKIDGLLPTEDGLFAFITYIQGIAKLHQASLTFSYNGTAVQPSAGNPGYIAFDATVSGSAENIRDFLEDIESKTTRFLVNVDSVDITGDGAQYRATLKGKVFFKAKAS
jgi:hypothetical protein